ncbi:zinc finger protein neuro-d4-like, partial [Haemorhous mexicanus]|uniref:zinc finger protein neuro-d4-like n=1 Tax=Haemorhous mexicanus TaxID=30427 RepID=UPI0028BD5436
MATALHKPLKCLGEEFYREALEHCRSYNARLCAERSLRLPFLDAQTGVAQSNSYIWMERAHRRPGLSPGQIYSYPARCWRKKRRLNILEAPRLRPLAAGGWPEGLEGGQSVFGGWTEQRPEWLEDCEAPLRKEGALPEGPVLEALLCAETPESRDEEGAPEAPKPPPPEFPHDPEAEEPDEDPPRRKNKAKGKAYGLVMKRRVDAVLEERDKPYVCD